MPGSAPRVRKGRGEKPKKTDGVAEGGASPEERASGQGSQIHGQLLDSARGIYKGRQV